MPEINNFTINTSDLGANKTARTFSIKGEQGFKFILQVVNAVGAFYNWNTKTFNAGFGPANNLTKTVKGTRYNGVIVFPSSTTTTYNVVLIAPPDSDTIFSEDIPGGGKNVLNKAISQVNDVNVVFGVTTGNTQFYGDPTTPSTLENPPAVSVTSTASPTQTGSTTVSNTWTVYNRDDETYGFGLRLIRQPIEKDWYFETTEAIVTNPAGDGVSNNKVVVADLSDLAVGTELIYRKGTTAPSSTTHISSIDTDTKTLTFSTSQAFENTETMTFRAYGAENIRGATGLAFTPTSISAITADHSITVRANDTDETIPITDTYGVSGGIELALKGEGLNTSSENVVTEVTTPDTNGTGNGVITMTLSSEVTAGTKLYLGQVLLEGQYVTPCTTQISISFTNTISTYPDENRNIYLNLDNFITPGNAG